MKGAYALIIRLEKNSKIKIGSLGVLNFKKGAYAYIGSAQNGLKQRINRHLRQKKRLHWHIDYLLNNPNAKVSSYHMISTPNKEDECRIAAEVGKRAKEVLGFGSSDCKCSSHLFYLITK